MSAAAQNPRGVNKNSCHWRSVAMILAIDKRLRKLPYPTLEDLVIAVAEKLDVPRSTRAVQGYLQEMRYNTALGFHAPIIYERATKAYHYSDPDYSLIKQLEQL